MRKLALAATIALGVVAIASPSLARPWADARLQLEVPASGNWTVVDGSHQTTSDRSYVEIAAPDDDCAFYSADAQIANAHVARTAMSEDARFSAQYLQQVATMFPRIIPAGATVTSNTVETSGAWPIRRISYRAGDQVAHAAIQWRPGLQLISACARYQGANSQASRYDAIFRSVGHPNDATWLREAASGAAQQQQQQQESAEAAAQREAAEAEAARVREHNERVEEQERRQRRGGRFN